jgi:hypothetical protein
MRSLRIYVLKPHGKDSQKEKLWLGTMAQVCNSSYSNQENHGMRTARSQKVIVMYLNQQARSGVHACHPIYACQKHEALFEK